MAMSAVEICNQALDMVGTGRHIKSFDDVTPEAEACSRLFKPTLETCLEYYQWSFARRDEVIDEDSILADIVSLPYELTYKIPDDVLKILFLTGVNASTRIETRAQRDPLFQYSLRNFDGQKVLATNQKPPFAIHYQCYTEDCALFTPLFTEAFSQMLGAKLCLPLVKGTAGMTLYKEWYQIAVLTLNNAANMDATQGEETATPDYKSGFLRFRR